MLLAGQLTTQNPRALAAPHLNLHPSPLGAPRAPRRDTNPMSAAFTITNTNLIPLCHLTAKILLGDVMTEPKVFKVVPHPRFGQRGGSPALTMPSWTDQSLNMDERLTITPSDWFGTATKTGRFSGAEFGIVVEYNPWLLRWKREKVFAFATRQQTNGQLYWYSIPND